jgi:hypothetical protein
MPVSPAAPLHYRLALALAAVTPALAAPEAKPLASQQVRFPQGVWSALPQVGPDGKVRQCVNAIAIEPVEQ